LPTDGRSAQPTRRSIDYADQGGDAQSPHGDRAVPGRSTGAGGEIRDEGATGRGAKPKAGLTGFSVSHLRIPRPRSRGRDARAEAAHGPAPSRSCCDGPLGGAAFNNEFGRPNAAAISAATSTRRRGRLRRGYDKPIMLAGGLGSIRREHVQKHELHPATR
jgi:phosphoribosylformylglycinamidine synthase